MYTSAALKELLSQSDLFFGNEAEIGEALRLMRLSSPRELLKHVETVVVTRGVRGSSVITEEEKTDVPCLESKTVDVVGAGDAYRAGFYAGLQKGWDAASCARLGASVSSFVVEGYGPQSNLPALSAALERLRSVG